MTKFKIQNKSQFQNPKPKIVIWDFGFIWDLVVFGSWIYLGLSFFCSSAFALNLDKAKSYFLEGDYKAAITEGEKLIAQYGNASGVDELYYVLGLSYLKDDNLLRASDIFEIILKEYKDSRFKEEARLGLADTYFLRQDFNQAKYLYMELLKNNPNTKLKTQAYSRLSEIGFKTGDTRQGKEYLDKLKEEFPSSPELRANKDDDSLLSGPSAQLYYTVQVGSFSKSVNANNLKKKLIQKGYPVYIEELNSGANTSYRVRVGKSASRYEIVALGKKLAAEGYPTKIYP